MFLFGHLGIGSKLAKPWSAKLPFRALLLGTILPDLIDKPTYYLLVLFTGKHGAELGMFGGTRLFGHTAIFLALLVIAASLCGAGRVRISRASRKSRNSGSRRAQAGAVLAAVALGVATHLLLDNVSDALLGDHGRSALIAMTWPWFGWDFPPIPFHSLSAHLSRAFEPHILACEALGLVILVGDYWKSRQVGRRKRA